MIPHIIASTQHLVDYEGGDGEEFSAGIIVPATLRISVALFIYVFLWQISLSGIPLAIRDWEQRKHKKLIGRLHVCNCKDSKLFII